ncbi:MAG: YggL family protein [Pararheinheimera sp.]|nr:YggL family protein [Rheinheimera sp.]
MSKPKSRRLQKKLYMGEFTEYGFMLSCSLGLESDQDFSKLLDQFIVLIESRDLVMAGGGDKTQFEAFIWSAHRYGSATQEDINLISDWFKALPTVDQLQVSELVDANYGVSF